MLAPALRLCTVGWPPVPAPPAGAWPAAGFGAAGAFTPVKSLPSISVTGPGWPVCGAGSASRFCAAGVALSAVISV
jgi:hypothetical protein